MTAMTRFTRQPNGAWRFESPVTGRTYEAGRQSEGWRLSEVTWYGVSDGRYNENTVARAEVFKSRSEAVGYAFQENEA